MDVNMKIVNHKDRAAGEQEKRDNDNYNRSVIKLFKQVLNGHHVNTHRAAPVGAVMVMLMIRIG